MSAKKKVKARVIYSGDASGNAVLYFAIAASDYGQALEQMAEAIFKKDAGPHYLISWSATMNRASYLDSATKALSAIGIQPSPQPVSSRQPLRSARKAQANQSSQSGAIRHK